MTVMCDYPSKKAMQECIGQPFEGEDPSLFGNRIVPGTTFLVCNRPQVGNRGAMIARRFKLRKKDGSLASVREFLARVTLDEDGNIAAVK